MYVNLFITILLFSSVTSSSGQPQCGEALIKQDIIIQDTPSYFGEFPWTLAMFGNLNRKESLLCSGSLIHPQVMLTAVYCVNRNTSSYRIRAGEWNLKNEDEPLPYQETTIKRVIKHPEYSNKKRINDVALVVLEKPFKLTDNVQTICLPDGTTDYIGSTCIGTGWGRTPESNSGSDIMKKEQLPVIALENCKKIYNKYVDLNESHLCAGGNGRDMCVGDGGSPLFCRVPQTERFVQVGVVSFGVPCGLMTQPSVYSNITHFKSWISSELENIEKSLQNQLEFSEYYHLHFSN